MESFLPQTYLLGLIGLLAIVAVVVGRQLLRVRRDEQTLIRLEQADAVNSRDAGDLYELASVQLRKRLYSQATATLRQAVKQLNNEPQEARALIQNALGFSLAAQKDFSTAIRHYKLALQAKTDYPVALNNLAFAEERYHTNIRSRWAQLSESQRTPALREALRSLDELVNVHWPLSHYRSAVRHLQRAPADIAATGGTNWQQYLPPRFQKLIFFPELWSQTEQEEWGKQWVLQQFGHG